MHRSTTRVLFVLTALLGAVTILESPGTVAGEESSAAGAGTLEVDRAMTLPEFLREVEKRVPALFTWRPEDRVVARTTVPLGAYPLDRAKLVRRMRALLFPHEIVLLASGTPPKDTYLVLDMRTPLKPGDPTLEPVRVDIASRTGLMHEHGLYVNARIPTAGLSNPNAVRRVLGVVLSPSNIGRISLLPDGSAFEVTDFAPRVDLIHRLTKELVALEAASR